LGANVRLARFAETKTTLSVDTVRVEFNLMASLTMRPMYPVPPKRRFLQEPHGVPSLKTKFFIVTAVKPSNLT
jgi:hypothetical protein